MRPEFGIISERRYDAYTVIDIDTKKATYQGRKWLDMGPFYRRKFENFIVLTRPRERLKFQYVH